MSNILSGFVDCTECGNIIDLIDVEDIDYLAIFDAIKRDGIDEVQSVEIECPFCESTFCIADIIENEGAEECL